MSHSSLSAAGVDLEVEETRTEESGSKCPKQEEKSDCRDDAHIGRVTVCYLRNPF